MIKGRPFGLAVDVGCSTGVSTRVLAEHFQQVVGIDINEAQIRKAKSACSLPNVSYQVAPAEKMPFEDGSVDLITVSVAAHWFNIETFLKESDRVLKTNGCVALYCLHPHFDLHYKDCSQSITDVFMETLDILIYEQGSETIKKFQYEYKDIFDVVPYADKIRITNIVSESSMSVAALMRFLESLFMFQSLFVDDPEFAKEFMKRLQERLLKIMGASSSDTELKVRNNYFCILACKSA
ncbi:hypothetical protein NDU88_010536 [Pleurodeles waltl]|uniref:Methyltransferase type 11 domain-containing protein n=1 Tax=Pleurodeles waltl TaxID=8319 RepID=A0AAV7PWA5_PLEWA|nr:hypothetical protein NDU88_010536 [Pleurodeles waltl]